MAADFRFRCPGFGALVQYPPDDSGGSESAVFQQARPGAEGDEFVGHPKTEDPVEGEVGIGYSLGYGAAEASHEDMLLEGDQGVMVFREIPQQLDIERFREAGIDQGRLDTICREFLESPQAFSTMEP